MLPDRSKYVSMEREFLSSYRQLVVATAHARGAPATGGMAANIVPAGGEGEKIVQSVIQEKRKEIKAGVDGFLIYDTQLAAPCRRLWEEMRNYRAGEASVISCYLTVSLSLCLEETEVSSVTADRLLTIPTGGVTTEGLKLNIAVTVVFIASWLRAGRGCLSYLGKAEDSATAEISRCQVWQWLHHGARLEETGSLVSLGLVRTFLAEFVQQNPTERETAGQIFLDLVTRRDLPQFITTVLSDSYLFRFTNKAQ